MSTARQIHLVRQPDVSADQIEFARLTESGCLQVAQAIRSAMHFGAYFGSAIPSAQQTMALLLRNGVTFPHGIAPPLPDLGDHLMVESIRAGDGTVPPFSPTLCDHPHAAEVVRRMRDGLVLIAVMLEQWGETDGLAVSHSPLIELLAQSCGFPDEITPLGPLEGFVFRPQWDNAAKRYYMTCLRRTSLLTPPAP